MLRAYVCRRKLPALLCTLATLAIAWTGLSYIFGITTRFHQPSRSSITYPDFFETYVNYSGPQPIPTPIPMNVSFRFVINEPDTCGEERHPGLRVLNYVHSAPHHFQHRKFIRRTWASPKFYSQFKMATVFFVGQTNNDRIQKLMERESARFQDIIQTDLPDSYYNLTYKAVSALAWISQFCSQAEYVVKTDDDVFINIFRLMEMLFQNSTRSDAIHCFVYRNGRPHRNPQSKWFIPLEEYPWKMYPDFCAGLAVYYGGHLVPKLYAATPDVPYLKFDDVYVTGMLRSQARIGIKNLGSAVNIFTGNTCLHKGHKSEVFCQMDSARLKGEMWMQLMMMEIKERAKKNEEDRLEYMEALADILNRDVQ